MTTKINREQLRQALQAFDFERLFIEEMGWGRAVDTRPAPMLIDEQRYTRRQIAHLSGIAVFVVTPPVNGELPDEKTRRAIDAEIEKFAAEHLTIFLDDDKKRTQSVWRWIKRDGRKRSSREHYYFAGQPGDLFLGKLDSLVVDLDELRPDGTLPITDAQRKLTSALDIERVTKRFYAEFSTLRTNFVSYISGINDETDRNWYASVLLNRLMFIYFLQKRAFIQTNTHYLEDQLARSQERGADRFYAEFLQELFFQGFAKPEAQRTQAARELIGPVKYLNGGLFLRHALEQKYDSAIHIPDVAFSQLLKLFGDYSWHLNDTPGERDDEINPDVLGYIFEKYINQKAFGAYYTRTEITGYLCERTIEAAILDKLRPYTSRAFASLGDALLHLDANLCRVLLNEVLPTLSVLDPACGSGAFIVAAMRTLLNIYGATLRRAEEFTDANLQRLLAEIDNHPSRDYYIRKRIITDNLYGVDIMPEATEIARLRLFLALVGSVDSVEKLEPLPNIDFNIMAGNSLIGLLRVDERRFNAANTHSKPDPTDFEQKTFLPPTVEQSNFLGALAANRYHEILNEKNRLITMYRNATSLTEDLSALRARIDAKKREHYADLNQLLLEDFQTFRVRFEEVQANNETTKRALELADITSLHPFHWGYEFDQIIGERGGFDAILTNPPWEIFKPNAKEFFADYSDLVTKNKMDIKDFEEEQEQLLLDPDVRSAWWAYKSRFPFQSAYFRAAPQFKQQSAIVNGKKTGTDVNLYKLFTEQCYNLLRNGGLCGTVIPSGIYTDLGTTGLRNLLFNQTEIKILFGLSNEKYIFEGVHHGFKIAILVFEKSKQTSHFEAAFRINPREAISADKLEDFLHSSNSHLEIPVSLVKRLSPDSSSIMEFKTEQDVTITEKMLKFPLLGEDIAGKWNIKFTSEFHMTNSSYLFHKERKTGMLPLYEGKMIHQFTHLWEGGIPRYWIDEKEGRAALIGKKGKDQGQRLDYQEYRLGFRDIAASTNERTAISTIIPRRVFTGNTVIVSTNQIGSNYLLAITSLFNSFVVDWMVRQKVTSHLNMFYVYQIPMPRLSQNDSYFSALVERSACLICTTPEYNDLAHEAGIGDHKSGATDAVERARLRAEIDGIVAYMYGLTEAEFTYILATFPLVSEPAKLAALNARRDVENGLIT